MRVQIGCWPFAGGFDWLTPVLQNLLLGRRPMKFRLHSNNKTAGIVLDALLKTLRLLVYTCQLSLGGALCIQSFDGHCKECHSCQSSPMITRTWVKGQPVKKRLQLSIASYSTGGHPFCSHKSSISTKDEARANVYSTSALLSVSASRVSPNLQHHLHGQRFQLSLLLSRHGGHRMCLSSSTKSSTYVMEHCVQFANDGATSFLSKGRKRHSATDRSESECRPTKQPPAAANIPPHREEAPKPGCPLPRFWGRGLPSPPEPPPENVCGTSLF